VSWWDSLLPTEPTRSSLFLLSVLPYPANWSWFKSDQGRDHLIGEQAWTRGEEEGFQRSLEEKERKELSLNERWTGRRVARLDPKKEKKDEWDRTTEPISLSLSSRVNEWALQLGLIAPLLSLSVELLCSLPSGSYLFLQRQGQRKWMKGCSSVWAAHLPNLFYWSHSLLSL